MNIHKYLSLDQIPLTLNAADIADVLGISRSKAYCLLNTPDFPALRLGKRLLVPKHLFLKWLDEQIGFA